jgi:hypothetical protein
MPARGSSLGSIRICCALSAKLDRPVDGSEEAVRKALLEPESGEPGH